MKEMQGHISQESILVLRVSSDVRKQALYSVGEDRGVNWYCPSRVQLFNEYYKS